MGCPGKRPLNKCSVVVVVEAQQETSQLCNTSSYYKLTIIIYPVDSSNINPTQITVYNTMLTISYKRTLCLGTQTKQLSHAKVNVHFEIQLVKECTLNNILVLSHVIPATYVATYLHNDIFTMLTSNRNKKLHCCRGTMRHILALVITKVTDHSRSLIFVPFER